MCIVMARFAGRKTVPTVRTNAPIRHPEEFRLWSPAVIEPSLDLRSADPKH
jgi:hypothetical protein